ncbi:hypothetical protein ACFE04_010569 [Oxalis oulophora]
MADAPPPSPPNPPPLIDNLADEYAIQEAVLTLLRFSQDVRYNASLHPKPPLPPRKRKRPSPSSVTIRDTAPPPLKRPREEQPQPVVNPYILRLRNDGHTQIGFLTGIVDYQESRFLFPFEDPTCFEEFIRVWLDVDVRRDELMKEIKRLKGKYISIALGMGNKEIAAFDAFNRKMFNLAHKIWGSPSPRKVPFGSTSGNV